MKKLFTFVVTMLLGAGLALAQTGGASGGDTQTGSTGKTATSKTKTAKTSKAHKGGKKSKKGASTDTSTTPK